MRGPFAAGAAYLGAAVLVLGAVFLVQGPLDTQRAALQLGTPAPSAGQDPLEVVVSALGPGKGVWLDYLWLKAAHHEKQREWWGFQDTCRRILEAQRDFAHVYDYLAWTLWTQVAQSFDDPPSRWHWTEEALKVLDRGIANTGHRHRLFWAKGFLIHRIFRPYHEDVLQAPVFPHDFPYHADRFLEYCRQAQALERASKQHLPGQHGCPPDIWEHDPLLDQRVKRRLTGYPWSINPARSWWDDPDWRRIQELCVQQWDESAPDLEVSGRRREHDRRLEVLRWALYYFKEARQRQDCPLMRTERLIPFAYQYSGDYQNAKREYVGLRRAAFRRGEAGVLRAINYHNELFRLRIPFVQRLKKAAARLREEAEEGQRRAEHTGSESDRRRAEYRQALARAYQWRIEREITELAGADEELGVLRGIFIQGGVPPEKARKLLPPLGRTWPEMWAAFHGWYTYWRKRDEKHSGRRGQPARSATEEKE